MNMKSETGQKKAGKPKDAKGNIIFVYGTLIRGNGNHAYFLSQSRFLGAGTLKGYALYDLGSYPGIKQRKDDFVIGELFEVDEGTLAHINRLEGEGSLYRLVYEPVQTGDQTVVNAGVYVYLHEVSESSYVSHEKQPWRGRR